MSPFERDELVRDIARRVFAEERAGRPVDDQRLTWAAEVIDQRQVHQPTTARIGEGA